ncbi:hypothetical protein AHAS_Ahas14G0120500 [Arachis hypogaea]
MWGIFYGLQTAWDLGIRKIIVETDALEVCQQITKGESHNQYNSLLRKVQDQLAKPWEVRVLHIHRKGNTCADWMAKHSLNKSFGYSFIDKPEPNLEIFMEQDWKVSRPTSQIS